jgi:hypothetical protein
VSSPDAPRQSDQTLRKRLAGYGLTAPSRFHPVVVAAGALGVAGTAALVSLSAAGDLQVEVASQGTAAILTVGALAFGVWQWRLATAEKSLDTLYARIDLANQRRLDAQGRLRERGERGRELSEDEGQLFFDYFVFTEIDNLEYATQKYVLGLLRPAVADRAVMLFKERCRKDDFRERAKELVEEGTYFPLTRKLVPRIADRVEASEFA